MAKANGNGSGQSPDAPTTIGELRQAVTKLEQQIETIDREIERIPSECGDLEVEIVRTRGELATAITNRAQRGDGDDASAQAVAEKRDALQALERRFDTLLSDERTLRGTLETMRDWHASLRHALTVAEGEAHRVFIATELEKRRKAAERALATYVSGWCAVNGGNASVVLGDFDWWLRRNVLSSSFNDLVHEKIGADRERATGDDMALPGPVPDIAGVTPSGRDALEAVQ